ARSRREPLLAMPWPRTRRDFGLARRAAGGMMGIRKRAGPSRGNFAGGVMRPARIRAAKGGVLILAISALGAAALAFQSLPQLPPPYHTESANNRPQVISQPDGAQIKVPAGFNVEVFADGFDVPRFMMLGPGNEILMSDSAQDGKGAVWVMTDGNRDGKL